MILDKLRSDVPRENLKAITKGLFSPRLLKQLFAIALAIGIYELIIAIPITFIDSVMIEDAINNSWLLSLLDTLATGGGMHKASLGFLGIIPYLMLITRKDVLLYSSSSIIEWTNLPAVIGFIKDFFFKILLLSLITVWLMPDGAVVKAPLTVLTASLLIATGSFIVHIVDIILRRNNGPSILTLNVGIEFIVFIAKQIGQMNNNGIFSPAGLIFAIILITSLIYAILRSRSRILYLANIAQTHNHWGVLPVPRLFALSETSLLVWVLYLAVITGFFIELVFAVKIDPFAGTISALIANIVFLSFLFVITKTLDITSVYSHRDIAQHFQDTFWVLPNTKPGSATAMALRKIFLQAQSFTFFVYLSLFLVWFCANLLSRQLFGTDLDLAFGYLGLTFITILSVEYLYRFFQRLLKERYIRSDSLDLTPLNFPLTSSLGTQEEAVIFELLMKMLEENLPDELADRVRRLVSDYRLQKANLRDVLAVMYEVQKYIQSLNKQQELDLTDSRYRRQWAIFAFLIATPLTFVIVAVLVILARLFFPQQFAAGDFRWVIVLTAIPIWFGLLLQFGIEDMLKQLVRRFIKSRKNESK
jgi:hypothetical protein